MNFISSLFGSKTKVVQNKNKYLQDRALEAINSVGKFDMSAPELCSSVFTSISIIANSVAKLPISVYKKTSKGKVPFIEHGWYNTITYNPDLSMSTSKWIAYALTEMYLTGNFFALKSEFDFDNLSIKKKELKGLGQVKNVVQYENDIYYKFDAVDNWIPSSELIHFYLVSKDGMIGLNPIASIRNEIEIQHGSEQTVKNYYQNGLFTILYMEVDTDMVSTAQNKNKLVEYAEKIEKDFQGYANSGKILRVPPAYKLKSLPLPDLKFLENSKYTISQIAALFQVPRWMVGAQENGGSYGKAEQEQLAFLNTCLANVCNIIKSELEQKLLTIEERNAGVTIDFDYSKLFTIDYETRANYLAKLSGIGAITPNEIRESFGYEKVDDEYMNSTYLQKQYVPVSMMGHINNNADDNSNSQSDSSTTAE